jgi:hypothetical protein
LNPVNHGGKPMTASATAWPIIHITNNILNNKIIFKWQDLLTPSWTLPEVASWWYWRRVHLGNNPVGGDGGEVWEVWDEDASLLVNSCLASDLRQVEGWHSGILALFFQNCIISKQISLKIWGFHSGGYEECRLLGCYTMWLL